jgi:imidazolonepropionase-like amidohydrolase
VTPTLYFWEVLYQPLNVDSMLALPEVRYVPPRLRGEWLQEKRISPLYPREIFQLEATLRRDLLRALNNAGVGIVMGTGSPRMFNVPGFSLRREIPMMREARLIPYEVLLTGTRNVGRYASEEMSEPGSFGVVREGNRADLILLNGNPLEDLDHLWNQVGVMVRGRWLPREWIEERLTAIEEQYSR